MKKIIFILTIFAFSINIYSQSCEEREEKMLTVIGGFSAGMLYNTYGIVGAVADGFTKDVYDEETVTNLMTAQKNMADNIIKLIDDNLKINVFNRQADKDYLNSVVDVINGLKLQAQLLIDLSATNSGKKKEAYEQQRQKNWSALSKLMGIDE